MALVMLTGGGFSDSAGNVLANGFLLCYLSHDEQNTSGPSQVVAGLPVKINLDNNGNVVTGSQLYANDAMSPTGSFYTIEAYTNDGRRAWSFVQYVTITSGSPPFNMSDIFPTNPPGSGTGGAGGSGIILETNGVLNANQALLNIESGTGITVTNPSSGNVLITNTGGTSFSGNGAFFFGPGIHSTAEVLTLPWQGIIPSSVNGVFTANQVVVYFFQLDVAFTISKATTQALAAQNGPTATFGIYSYSGNLLVDTNTFATAFPDPVITNTFTPVTLPAGTYWHAQAITASIHFPGISASTGSIPNAQFTIWTTNSTRAAFATNTLSAGRLPATLGALTAFTPIASDTDGICCPLYE